MTKEEGLPLFYGNTERLFPYVPSESREGHKMNFPEKVKKALLELRLSRSTLTADNMETHKKDMDKIIGDLDAAVKEYWEAENG